MIAEVLLRWGDGKVTITTWGLLAIAVLGWFILTCIDHWRGNP